MKDKDESLNLKFKNYIDKGYAWTQFLRLYSANYMEKVCRCADDARKIQEPHKTIKITKAT